MASRVGNCHIPIIHERWNSMCFGTSFIRQRIIKKADMEKSEALKNLARKAVEPNGSSNQHFKTLVDVVTGATSGRSASACSFSTWHFLKVLENSVEVLKVLENSVEVLKILENKFESMKIQENKLESLKLQENQPVDGLVPLSIKRITSEIVFERLLKSRANKF
ncbi:hypothetical protein Tco_0617329 [Tanacetum coccineum]